MNSKLINELVEFSDFHVGNEHYNKSPKEQQRIFMEFFTEMIVKECVLIANQTVIGSDKVGDAIKKRFGVE